jgi:hypothetical protein
MLGAAKRIFTAIISQIEPHLFILIFRVTKILDSILNVVFLFLQDDWIFKRLNKLIWVQAVMVLYISPGAELKEFFDYFFVNAEVFLVFDISYDGNVKHRIAWVVLLLDVRSKA